MGYYVNGGGMIEFKNPVAPGDFEYDGMWELYWDGQTILNVSFDGKFNSDLEDGLMYFASFGITALNVEMSGECGEFWRYRWDGKKIVEDPGRVVYDMPEERKFPSYERLLKLFADYVSKDYEDVASGEGIALIYDKLRRIGCKDSELEATGLGWLIREEENL